MKTETIRDVGRHDDVGMGTLSRVINSIPSASKDARIAGLAIPHYLSIIVYNDIALADY